MGAQAATAERDERIQFGIGNEAALVPAGVPAPGGNLPAASVHTAAPATVAWSTMSAALAKAAAREEARGTGFLWVPVLLGCGALIYFTLPVEPPAYAILSSITVCAIALALASGHFWRKHAILAALMVLLGLAAGQFEAWRKSTPMLGGEITTRVTGRVLSVERRADGRHRLTVAITQTERPELRYAPDRARLTARAVSAGLAPGDGVKGLVRLMPPSGPVRPQAYDFSFESFFDGIGAVGFFMRDPERVAMPDPASFKVRLAARLQALREAFATRLRERIAGPDGEIAAALITGMRAGIPEETSEILRRAGLAHVLAISGLHMALVAFTIIGAVRLGFAFFPGVCARYPVKKYAAAAALLVCLLYLFISGAAVAAQRSFIMLAVMLAAQLIDRAALTMRNLAIAALVVIAFSPHEVVGPGFQMSFAATVALIAGYAAWNNWRERRLGRRMPPQETSRLRRATRLALLYVGGLALTSLIAGSATALYGAWHFQRASPLALGTNLVAMPLVSLIVMPSAVVSVLAMPFNLDGGPLALMGWGIGRVVDVARWFSERTPFDATGLVPLPATLLLTAALVVLTLTTTRIRLAAIPLLIAGAGLLLSRDLPDVLVAEDGRLVAMRTADGRLAVNRARPNGFTMENWLRVMRTQDIVKPRPSSPSASVDVAQTHRSEFACDALICIARHESGALVAHVAKPRDGSIDGKLLKKLCRRAQLLVVDDPTIGAPCAAGEATVISSRDLARHGSGQIRFTRTADGRYDTSVVFAIREPWRPWHAHRQYSRQARGLAAYRNRSGG
ncbi:ComEC/Rec2 family competence protein [Nitratireductor soli]|uniref:ComEC/Rec2 family competence protein n=1 Tax=Nitratireductor soli TaxID=1670619 RepID=UPI00065DED87|nr:ComEC/Rec2 family competence protein [Nitratireductor soli]